MSLKRSTQPEDGRRGFASRKLWVWWRSWLENMLSESTWERRLEPGDKQGWWLQSAHYPRHWGGSFQLPKSRLLLVVVSEQPFTSSVARSENPFRLLLFTQTAAVSYQWLPIKQVCDSFFPNSWSRLFPASSCRLGSVLWASVATSKYSP